MPRPKSLTAEIIAAAALTVIDRDGLPALSMRSVAAELGIGTMSLYRYVESREALEDLVIARVLGEVDAEVSSRSSWKTRVTALVNRARTAIGEHPALIPLVLTRSPTTAALQSWGEQMLAALAAGGFEGKERAIAFRTINKYMFGAVQLEHFGPAASPRTTALAALPAGEFPYLTETARHAARISAEEEFRKGLEIVLRGLASA
jgi:AcrR family transcriptional regulator